MPSRVWDRQGQHLGPLGPESVQDQREDLLRGLLLEQRVQQGRLDLREVRADLLGIVRAEAAMVTAATIVTRIAIIAVGLRIKPASMIAFVRRRCV